VQGPLAQVLALERVADVATVAPAYARAMRALAAALDDPRRRVGAQAEVSAWLLGELGLPDEGGHDDREALWDAAVDLLGDAGELARFFGLVAARLEGGLRPARLNLASILRAKVGWRARDGLRRRAAVRARLVDGDADGVGPPVQARYLAALVVRRMAEQFGDDAELETVLARLWAGESVSEVSAATGLSRPTIYRRLERVRRWIDGAEETSEARLGRGRV
jgi:hypothetical protein